MKQFKDNLKQIRKEKQISQKELANKLNIKQSTISAYEKGTRQPNLQTLIKLSQILDTSIDYLITGEEFKNKYGKNLTIQQIEQIDKSINNLTNQINEIFKK